MEAFMHHHVTFHFRDATIFTETIKGSVFYIFILLLNHGVSFSSHMIVS